MSGPHTVTGSGVQTRVPVLETTAREAEPEPSCDTRPVPTDRGVLRLPTATSELDFDPDHGPLCRLPSMRSSCA